ncbi:MAG: tetratricopeptide repeat protein [Candidatus Aminicenantes bacterium]|nr:tetratricopeptide repeat protein [Candidatus Aminicenantes bacterium]
MPVSADEREKIEALAEKLVKKGKFAEAIAEYQKLITGDEQDIPVRTILGDLYLNLDMKDKAIAEFRQIAEFYQKKGIYSKSIALYKRIHRLNPADLDSLEKLAELYRNQGFISESKIEYENLLKILLERKDRPRAIKVLNSLLEIDPGEIDYHLKLADLYLEEKKPDLAVEELNDTAEILIRKQQVEEAGQILEKAKKIDPEHPRTLTNLLDVYRLEGRKKEGLSLIPVILSRDANNLKALHVLGETRLEDGKLEEAEDIFLKIIKIRPKDVDARVKLGKVYINQGKLDLAFKLYEPLVDSLLQKKKEEKAIGLLGLILAVKKPHLPTLEKLAAIYRTLGMGALFEKTASLLLEEYEEKRDYEKMLGLLKELTRLFPEKKEYEELLRRKRIEAGLGEEREERWGSAFEKERTREFIEAQLVKADMYAEQGLYKNARRILEHLRFRFPEEPLIEQKLEDLKKATAELDERELARRVERVTERETVLFGRPSGPGRGLAQTVYEEQMEEKLTAAELFAETDIIPVIEEEVGEKVYFDLSSQIKEEFEALRAILDYQIKGDTAIVEKALTDIVAEFKQVLEERIPKEDYETHYNLGLAFMEQELFEEAIEEFLLAMKSESLELDSYVALALCYKATNQLDKAMEYLQQAFAKVKEGSFQYYSLKYEEAEILRLKGEVKKALKIFQEIKKWNPDYRDVQDKIKQIKKSS